MKLPIFRHHKTQIKVDEETGKITLPFYRDFTTFWDISELDYQDSNEAPNFNLAVAGLILSANIELTEIHPWKLTEDCLEAMGFTNIKHHYFDLAERVNYPAMVFGRSKEPVNGKYVVAAIFRGTSSIEDIISDIEAEPKGFHEAGINSANELKAYVNSQSLTKENTTLFITGHSYGASTASLVALMSTDLAERDSIFCYSFATPNYIRNGVTGDGMKMFCFASNEDVVPQVPVGPMLDKTGAVIGFDRMDLKLNHNDQYQRFDRVYRYLRHNGFDEDSDFLPPNYSLHLPISLPINNEILRNHMPFTYMSLILSELPDEIIDTYLG